MSSVLLNRRPSLDLSLFFSCFLVIMYRYYILSHAMFHNTPCSIVLTFCHLTIKGSERLLKSSRFRLTASICLIFKPADEADFHSLISLILRLKSKTNIDIEYQRKVL